MELAFITAPNLHNVVIVSKDEDNQYAPPSLCSKYGLFSDPYLIKNRPLIQVIVDAENQTANVLAMFHDLLGALFHLLIIK